MNYNVTGMREKMFLNYLSEGNKISRSMVKRKFNLRNPSAAIARFVKTGIDVNRVYKVIGRIGPYRIKTVTYSINAEQLILPGMRFHQLAKQGELFS